MGEVRSINALRAERENNNDLLSPLEAIEDAAADIRAGKVNPDKVLILMLTTKDADGGDQGYGIERYSSHLARSEAVALLHVVAMKYALGLIGRD